MKTFRQTTLGVNLAFTIFVTLGVSHAATDPAQISINGADLGAASAVVHNSLFSGPGMNMAKGASRPVNTNPAPIPPISTFGFFPADLQNPSNNLTLTDLTVHDIFVNPLVPSAGVFAQAAAGHPTLADTDSFMNDLLNSAMIHITDQYTGNANPTRTVGQGGVITYLNFRTTMTDSDLALLVHAAARTFGAGSGQLYHLFFKQGIDICSTSGTSVECYSPDNPSTFFFCGFHDFYNFPDIGKVYYSVQPYQNVSGCSGPSSPASAVPNGVAIDSMASTLSHETFEAITDPGLNSWFNRFGAFGGNEIADECAFVFSIPAVVLNGHSYQIQAEYSNQTHECTWFSNGTPPQ